MPSVAITNRGCMLLKPKTIEIQDIGVPQIGPDEVLVQCISTGICGSDVHNYTNGGIGTDLVKAPLCLGHETAGLVAQVGSNVKDFVLGQKVAIEPGIPCRLCAHCKHGRTNLCYNLKHASLPPTHGSLCQYYATHQSHLVPIPEGISWEEAGSIQPLAVAVQLARRAHFTAGQTVAVFGCGPLGLLVMAVARAFGVSKILAFDISGKRVKFAKDYIADFTAVSPPLSDGQDLTSWSISLKQEMLAAAGIDPKGVDVVVEASGAEPCMHAGIEILHTGGTYVQAGLGKPITSFPTLKITSKELTVVGTVRYTGDCFETAIGMMASGAVDLKPLITKTYPLTKSIEAFEAVREGSEIKVVVMNQE
ncbi:hypothetical protein IAR55_003030 [Kwoniella newhampshirensis]|uniref:Enoyl reductase (ER) domain-containing protein n=1 Tax=Kwoniella newhampshirensis TaxID=1651941 RepID=A0AAW0YY46_9TREE